MTGPKIVEIDAKARKIKEEKNSGVAGNPTKAFIKKEVRGIAKAKKYLLTIIKPLQLSYVKEGDSFYTI